MKTSDSFDVARTDRILDEVVDERIEQNKRYGVQIMPDGTGGARWEGLLADAREDFDFAAKNDSLTWAHVLNEEVLEAFAEKDVDRLRAELIQVAAVAVQWVESLDMRRSRS